jgi:hypothetical protein
MELWQVRNQALAALSDDLTQENEILERCFALFDECIERFYSFESNGDSNERFAYICGQTLVKARRLALGSYSLCLDGLALEAGALARSLIEVLELLVYFYLKPERIEGAYTNRLPSAGGIARAINDKTHNDLDLQGLRNHYNQFSSHISFHEEALAPANIASDRAMLKTNIRSLFLLMMYIENNAALCLLAINQFDNRLREKIILLQEDGFRIFESDE